MPPRTAPSLLSTPLIKPGGSQQSRPIEIEIAYSRQDIVFENVNFWIIETLFWFIMIDIFVIKTFSIYSFLTLRLLRLINIYRDFLGDFWLWTSQKSWNIWYLSNFKQTSRSQLISQSWLRLEGLFFGLDCLDKGIDLNRFCLNYREQTFEAGNSFSDVKIKISILVSIKIMPEKTDRNPQAYPWCNFVIYR